MSSQTPLRVDITCTGCGATLTLYRHDGPSHLTVRIICVCGAGNERTFGPMLTASRRSGFGMRAR